MNYIDYENWANEYREQIDIIDKKLEKRKERKTFPTAEDRRAFENSTKMLREMRLDCIKTMVILEKKAAEIKEAECYAKNVVA